LMMSGRQNRSALPMLMGGGGDGVSGGIGRARSNTCNPTILLPTTTFASTPASAATTAAAQASQAPDLMLVSHDKDPGGGVGGGAGGEAGAGAAGPVSVEAVAPSKEGGNLAAVGGGGAEQVEAGAAKSASAAAAASCLAQAHQSSEDKGQAAAAADSAAQVPHALLPAPPPSLDLPGFSPQPTHLSPERCIFLPPANHRARAGATNRGPGALVDFATAPR